ncbi:DUF2855 family protein [Planotetraspora phitsanulokensis]|uniref:DUF2855 family protein n=1 Tax=Planotetraspora phitsanulokensis TaxID=575192 RepID=A0A8J3U026_9ACTN|nr:DUF2855 family protein [Planotetraspora phitsanulokensis]GII35741.1 hypothetical protein Pph01_07440 [Planotetraspora phitsanulokensis]
MKRDLEVRRGELARVRVVEEAEPEVGPGQALLRVDRYGLTSNNVTYAMLGDTLRYWDFFPAQSGWGRIPAWGFADVVTTRVAGLAEGVRVFGLLPMSTHLLVTAQHDNGSGFVDRSPHRAALPAAYNHYRHLDGTDRSTAMEERRMLLWPLFSASFLIDDLLGEHRCFGADAVVLSSASSKTAIGAAFLLRKRPGVTVVGLTSPANLAFVTGLGVYDSVVAYDALAGLPDTDTALVDLAGNARLQRQVHDRYADRLRARVIVGATHGDLGREPGDALHGPTPLFFFAADQIRRRAREWGLGDLEDRIEVAWQGFRAASAPWFRIDRRPGPDAAVQTYLDVLQGRADPSIGHILSMWAPGFRATRPPGS